MLAAGATVTVAACAPVPTAAPPGSNPTPVTTVVGPAWIHPKSLVRDRPGYGGAHLTWKIGDTVKWLPPEKYPNDAASDALAKVSKTNLLEVYRRMYRSRVFESTMKDVNLAGWPRLGDQSKLKSGVYGSGHMRIGQEAEAIAMGTLVLQPQDYIAATHAGHHDLAGRGADVNKMTAEFFMRKTGYNKGYGGTMHLTAADLNILGMNPIVGADPPIAAGAAWASKVKKSGQVAVPFYGDGAQNSRYFFNTVRQSANYKLPVVFCVENNWFSAGNFTAMLHPCPYLADYAVGLGIPAVPCDGNSVAAVYAAGKELADRARALEGPGHLEVVTFRWYDHSGFAGAKAGVDGAFGLPYRTDDEVRAWMGRDPIVRYTAWLLEKSLATQAELNTIKAEVDKAQNDAIDFSLASPLTTPEDGCANVWPLTERVPAMQFFEHTIVVPK
jgi:pyruvate dehydrogenase E1 component alpha subunit